MTLAFLIQTGASAVAIGLMVALAAWARAGRAAAPLDSATARALFDEEFPGRALDGVWVASDRAGAMARSGDRALVLVRVGDSYAARDLAWDDAARAKVRHSRISLRPKDPGAPMLSLKVGAWPPRGHGA